jgi:hypothetical protein
MKSTMPGTPRTAPSPILGEEYPPGRRGRAGRFAGVLEFLFPFGEATRLHTSVVAAVLVLDAVLIIVLPARLSGITSTGPAVYLVLPVAAAVYMSLAAMSTHLAYRIPGNDLRSVLLPVASLGWSVGLLGLLAASAEPWRSSIGLSSTTWLLPASLAGIALPILSFWWGPSSDVGGRPVGLSAALLPPVIALLARPPNLTASAALIFTLAALLLAAALFEISGSYRGRSSPAVTRPAPVPGLTSPIALRSRLTFLLRRRSPRGEVVPLTRAEAVPPDATSVDSGGGSRSILTSGRWPNVVSSGSGWLDHLLLGGFPRRGQLALVGEAGLGIERVVWGTLAAGLRRGESVVIVTASLSVREIADRMERFRPGFTDFDRAGKVIWVDASGQGHAAHTDPQGILGPGDCVRILGALRNASKEAERQSPLGFCVGFLGITTMLETVGDSVGLAVLRNSAAILRGSPALVTYSLEISDRPGTAVGAMLAELDGTFLFRPIDGRPSVKVFRLGPVETRGWVECQFEIRDPVSALGATVRERATDPSPWSESAAPAP